MNNTRKNGNKQQNKTIREILKTSLGTLLSRLKKGIRRPESVSSTDATNHDITIKDFIDNKLKLLTKDIEYVKLKLYKKKEFLKLLDTVKKNIKMIKK